MTLSLRSVLSGAYCVFSNSAFFFYHQCFARAQVVRSFVRPSVRRSEADEKRNLCVNCLSFLFFIERKIGATYERVSREFPLPLLCSVRLRSFAYGTKKKRKAKSGNDRPRGKRASRANLLSNSKNTFFVDSG